MVKEYNKDKLSGNKLFKLFLVILLFITITSFILINLFITEIIKYFSTKTYS